MAPTIKLTYFDIYGVAEPIRFLLRFGGLEFEDIRIDKNDWPMLKPKTPYGVLPLLEYQGKVAHQSISIARYIAKEVKLVGDNYWEDLEIDSTVDTVNDLRAKLFNYFVEEDPELKKQKSQELFTEGLPFFLKRLDEQAKKNKGYLALSKLTWADVFFVGLLDFMNAMAGRDIIVGYPYLQSVRSNVLSIPNIQTWIQKRPKCNL